MPNLEYGYDIIETFLTGEQLTLVLEELHLVSLPENAGGIRNAEKKFTSIKQLAASDYLTAMAQKYLTGSPKLVRAILFNKTLDNNWLVSWHQDRTVAVSEKFNDPEWGPWSIKDGVHHVQPPLSVLNQMVTFRIHLDDTNLENGCIKVHPNSHQLGILAQADIQHYIETHTPTVCEAKAGSALVMRPHILHASSKATQPSQRRVLHLEYSSFQLPSGVTWA